MNDIKIIDTGKTTILAVNIPEDAHSFEIQENPVEGGNHISMLLGTPDYACVFSPNLPEGDWQIVNLSNEITEEQARKIIPHKIARFIKYPITIPNRFYETAKEAFNSLMQSENATDTRLILEKL